MKKLKSILSVFLAVIMLAGVFSFSVSAAKYGDLTYEIRGSEVVITGCDWSVTEVEIPARINGYPVTKIGDYAFSICAVESVTIPDSVTSVGNYAFQSSCLRSVTIPAGVTYLGEGAFAECFNLEGIYVDADNRYFSSDDAGVLYDKSKTELMLYPSAGNTAEYTIPGSVTTIHSTAFERCSNLKKIKVAADNPYYSNDEYGVLFNKAKTDLIRCPQNIAATQYIIPDGVIRISDGAFINCQGLANVTMPRSVTTIGVSAFMGCGITDITIPDSVITIKMMAFKWCNNIESVTIPGSVSIISNTAFCACSNLKEVIISDGVTAIENASFSSCTALESVTLPASLDTIDAGAFAYCEKLSTVYFSGTSEQWDDISIDDEDNEYLLNSALILKPEEHLHSYTVAVTAPTCTQQGYTTHTCSCGESYTDDYVDATGHKEIIIPAIDATCNRYGLTEGKKCSVCGEIIVSQEDVPPTEHKEEVIPGKPATCNENGLTEGKKCSLCGEIIVSQEEIPATGHSFGDWVVVREATYTQAGEEERACSACGEKETRTISQVDFMLGDVNNDGRITASDARAVLRVSAKLDSFTHEQITVADVDKNGKITASDARMILRVAAKIDEFATA